MFIALVAEMASCQVCGLVLNDLRLFFFQDYFLDYVAVNITSVLNTVDNRLSCTFRYQEVFTCRDNLFLFSNSGSWSWRLSWLDHWFN